MPDGQQNPSGTGALGVGCVTRVFAVPLAVAPAAENAAVEMADAKKKTPARAIDLSMGFSCVLVVANDAGPPGCDDPAVDIRWLHPANQGETPSFCGNFVGELY